ncbi:MAG: AMP-dependent synthetase [Deltaproteobacteria bacterium]|nr:MAG: AMP-dependent synthetase [Deltaproteobacteria bacterium]
MVDFRWLIPERFNMGADVADRHRGALALVEIEPSGKTRELTFDAISALSNRLANVLVARGLRRGDRIAILLPQRHETAVAHAAAWKAGMISVPLFTLFGEEALEFRLQNSGARAIVTDREQLPKLTRLRHALPDLKTVLCVDGEAEGALDLHALAAQASDRFQIVDTSAEDPALIIYTSGTTGQPKGALHAHRTLLGHLPGVEYPHDGFPKPGDRFWTPADWAWIGGLFDVVMPAWHHGITVVAHRPRKFDPGEAMRLMARHEVRNVFMPPTALKLLRASGARDPGVRLRSLASGGESLGEELIEWGRSTLGLTINEFYGQTECNLVVGNGAELPPVRPGWTGTAIPGHTVAIVDEQGRELPAGELGSIAYKRPDPVMFLEYWRNESATRAKFRGDWLVSGDLGLRDEAGYFRFVGRDDDLITSGGYRIGPGEIEACLTRHPAVALAAVVGEPDPVRTEVVKAVIVLKQGFTPGDALKAELQEHVRSRLAAHEYPRIVEFVKELPLTATGKIIRRALRSPKKA